MELSAREKHQLRKRAYLAGFFLNLNFALAAYIDSSFLQKFVGEHWVGALYSFNALLTILLSFSFNHLTRRYGNKRVLFVLTLLNLAAYLGLIFYIQSVWAVAFMIAS